MTWIRSILRFPSSISGRDLRWMRAGFGIWIALGVVFTAHALLHPRPKLVYRIFANASRQWWTDSSIYATYEGLDVYRYSPTFATLLTPLSVFPDRLSVVLWNLLSITILFAALRLLVRELLPGEWPPWREGLFLFLTCVGTVRGIWSGQTNALVTACAIFAVVAVARQRWWAAAFLLAGPIFIKIWPGALFLLLVPFCWRRLALRFGAASLAFAVVPFLTRSPSVVVSEYVAFFETLARTAPMRWRGYRDAWTILEQFGPVDPNLYAALQIGSGLAALGWCLWRGRNGFPRRRLLLLILAVWVGWQLLFGPGTERLTYGLIAPFATWLLLRAYRERRLRVLASASWLCTGILGSGNFGRLVQPVFPYSIAISSVGVVFYLMYLLIRDSGAFAGEEVEPARA